ncbi:MAG: serine/threonine-protein kinase [Gemmatimonadales bacterium]
MDVLKGFRHHVSLSLADGTSFQEELGETLRQRLRAVYTAGFLIGVALFLFYSVVPFRNTTDTVFTPHINTIYNLYPISLGLAAAIVLFRRWNTRQLLVIDYIVLTFVLLLSLFVAAIFDLVEVPTFGISLALFIHAAIVPVPVGLQAGLAVTGALGYPIAMGAAYFGLPEIRAFWDSRGVGEFRNITLEGTFYLTILAVVSVLITKALYNMRQQLHQARRLGSYLIEEELGEGGMGQVYVAQHALMCRPTAVKVIHPEKSGSDEAVRRFEREVRLSAALTHPNTITIYDFGHTPDNTFYYAMEYLDGLDLQVLVERFGPMEAGRVVYLLEQVCGSLAEAHSMGVIHRDIKPSNIFLTKRGGLYDFAKVLDFGLAKEIGLEDAGTVTKSGMILGTPHYFAPESIEGADKIDGRADIYNVGGVAYWMLTGQPPFVRPSAMEVILDHVRATASKPSEIAEVTIPAELDEIVMRCLAKDPGDRFQSAEELQDALTSVPVKCWTQSKAREWWELHAPFSSQPAGNGGLAAEVS